MGDYFDAAVQYVPALLGVGLIVLAFLRYDAEWTIYPGIMLALFFGIAAGAWTVTETLEWKETGQGEHVGYVTAVQHIGWPWATWDVFFKTDSASTQEDVYCVRPQHEDIIPSLRAAARDRRLVTITYIDYVNVDWEECTPSTAAIVKVS